MARLAKMYRVPPTGPRRPAVGGPVERRVRRRCWLLALSDLDCRTALCCCSMVPNGPKLPILLTVIGFEPSLEELEGTAIARLAAAQQTDFLKVFCLVLHRLHRFRVDVPSVSLTDFISGFVQPCRAEWLCIPRSGYPTMDEVFQSRIFAVTKTAQCNCTP